MKQWTVKGNASNDYPMISSRSVSIGMSVEIWAESPDRALAKVDALLHGGYRFRVTSIHAGPYSGDPVG